MADDSGTLKLVLEQALRQLDSQRELREAHRTKASIILASAGLLYSRILEIGENPMACPFTGLVLAALIVLASAALAIVALWPRPFRQDPDPRGFAEACLDMPLPAAREQLLVNLLDTYKENEDSLRLTTGALQGAFLGLMLSLIGLLAIVISQWSVSWPTVAR